MDENTQDENVTEEEVAAEDTELSKAQAAAEENLIGWQRAMADYANLKRESEQMRAETAKYAVGELVVKLLPVIESFRQAAAQSPIKEGESLDETRISQWIDGIGHVKSQLDSILAAAGVSAIDQEGVEFDPNLHEAMLSETREGVEPGQVLKILESGAKLHDRVLKPARVTVSE